MSEGVRNGKLLLYTFLEVIAVFCLTAIAGLYDWVNWKFSLERFLTQQYWIDTTVKTIMYSMSVIIGVLGVLEWNELHSQAYFDLLASYRDTLHKYKTKGFVIWVQNVLNVRIKIEALHKKFELKLHFLDWKTRDRCKIEYKYKMKDQEYKFKHIGSKHYYNRRTELDFVNSDEYINENHDVMHVFYKKVNPYAFTEYLDIHISANSQYKVENKVVGEAAFHIFRKVVMAFMSAAIMALFLIDPSREELLDQANGWIAIVIKYVIRVMMIGFNVIMGIFTGKRLFNNNYMLPLLNRRRILEEFHVYDMEHPAPTQIEKEREILRLEFEKKLELQVAEIKEQAASIIQSNIK